MRQYTIQKGKHFQFNLHRLIRRLLPIRARKGKALQFQAVIENEPYDIRPDPDQADRHKLIGFGLKWFTIYNNKDAAMISFQPDPGKGVWNICAYVNHDFGWSTGDELEVLPGEQFAGRIELIGSNTVEIVIWNKQVRTQAFYYTWRRRPRLLAQLLPWHGGADNEGNGIGGVAPEELNIRLDYQWT